MTTQDWLNFAKIHQQKLEYLIGRYHPVRNINEREYQTKRLDDKQRITAPNAERACENVRNSIRQNFEGDPITQFAQALKTGDVNKINSLLNDAWFGVPESTSCWNIHGFREAVTLMEDLPDDTGEAQEN